MLPMRMCVGGLCSGLRSGFAGDDWSAGRGAAGKIDVDTCGSHPAA